MATVMRLPRSANEGDGPSGREIDYELLEWPLPLQQMGFFKGETGEDGLAYTEWAARTEPERVPVFLDFIARAGGPSVDLSASEESLGALTGWVKDWFPSVMAPWYRTVWENDGTGWVVYPGGWDRSEESRRVASLNQSLAHDLGFLVVAAARRVRPELTWTLCQFRIEVKVPRGAPPPRYWVPTLSPTALGTSPFWEPRGLLDIALHGLPPYFEALSEEQRVAMLQYQFYPPRPVDPLVILYQTLLDPIELEDPWQPPPIEEGPGAPANLFSRRRFDLRRPAGDLEPAPEETVQAVAALRSTGWFSGAPRRLDDRQLAGVLAAEWVDEEGEELQVGEALWEQLIGMDEQRCVVFDPESDVCAGAMMYRAVIHALGTRSGGLLHPTRVKEDWRRFPGEVLVSFRNGAERVEFRVDDVGDHVHPAVVTEVNRLLAPDGPRFYFLDNGAQTAVIVRATAEERAALEARTPLRLREDPPDWWSDVCVDR